MSDAFSDREKGFERKFEFDQQQLFKVKARRDRHFGLWVAAQIGKTDAAADTYAAEVVKKNFDHPGDADMLNKVRADLKAHGVVIVEPELLKQLGAAELKARVEILGPEA
jgi:hypothetical protein